MLYIDNLVLPPVNFPFGDFVTFEPLSVSGPISDTGHVDIPVTLQMVDTAGNETSIDFVLSTGSTSLTTSHGTTWTSAGDPLSGGNSLRLVGGANTPLNSSTSRLPFTIDMKVANVQID